jgi:hypothetical protein
MSEFVRTYIERNISGSWVDISSYVVNDIELEYLISSPDADNQLAGIGRLSLVMNNGDGSFSPNGNFQRGIGVRVRTVYDGYSKTRFLGKILNLDPDTLEWGDQYVRVTAVDWLHDAANYPSILPTLQEDMTVDDAVAYLLGLMSRQPESVEYKGGRETFDFVFDNLRNQTNAYTELNRLALSEFAPIYLKAGNILVVESADTRSGLRELTKVPLTNTNSGFLLKEDGGYLLQETGGKIILDQVITPNFASGTVQPIDIEMENGGALTNRGAMKTYPSREDVSSVLLYQLDSPITISTFGAVTIKGTYADPNGGQPISAKDFEPLTTGTNYVFTDKDNVVDQSTQLVITPNYGSQGFEHRIFNNGEKGVLRQFKIYGIGIYPYNPLETAVNVTGSINTYSVSEMAIDQRYQDDVNASLRIAEIITDDEKEPRNRLLSITFDASSSADLMQASQFMDSGDLTYIKNVKPSLDTYAYIRGRKTIITLGGVIVEKWYLKEMDSLRKGLKPVALRYTSLNSAQNGVDFGRSSTFDDLDQKTLSGWIYNLGIPANFPPFSKYDGVNGWYFFGAGSGSMLYNHHFTPTDGQWETDGMVLSGSAGHWKHVALTYDRTSDANVPSFYVDGLLVVSHASGNPVGTSDTDADANLVLGNFNYPGFQFIYRHNGYLKDMRIYNRILSPSEIALIAANPNNYLTVPDGLVFQAPTVKTEDYGNLTGSVLYPNNLLIDNVYSIRGTPHWYVPSGTAFALKAYDPNF